MLDESTCFNCGKASSGNSFYCSEACRIQECGDASASASNSSVAPSSASSSPSRTSPKIVPARHRSDRARGANGYYERQSRTSSRTSSPSLHTSDLAEFSDFDVEIAATSKMGRLPQDHTFNQALFQSSQKVLDHAFWKSRYAEFGAPTTLSAYDEQEAASNGSKSMPGVPAALHYTRKPGPINASNIAGASKLAAAYSPHSSHKRYGSEYGFHSRSSRGASATTTGTERLTKQGSTESATSSTPKSKSAVTHLPTAKRLQTTTSDSTLSNSYSKPSASASMGVRHVSDTMVHTLRKTIEPLTAVDPPVDPPSSYHRSIGGADSLALSALKDVARSHGMIDDKSRLVNPRVQESSIVSLGRSANLLGLNSKASTESSKYPSAHRDNLKQNSRQRPLQDQKGALANALSDDGVADHSSPDGNGRGRSKKRVTPSRSPSPPTWASWAEDEPIDRRRGRSARRGQ